MLYFNSFAKTIGLLLLTSSAIAQNLVINGDFEHSIKNPCRFLSDSNENISQFFLNWTAPTRGTSDPWYTSDTVTSYCTQNLKRIGYLAHSGKRCAGIYTAAIVHSRTRPEDGPNYREYLQTKLREPLREGRYYTVEVYCRRHPWSGTTSNNIGFYFSVSPITGQTNSSLPLAVKPQVNIEQPIDSFSEWIKVGGCFKADANYEFLTIGNFFDDRNTIIQAGSLPNRDDYPYYLLDDVSVVETPVEIMPKPGFLGADTTLCPQQSLTFHLPNVQGVTYRWSDGSNRLDYSISQTGSYLVTAQLDQCVVNDTITVHYEELIRLAADTALCDETPFVIRPNRSDPRLIWSDGSTDSTLTVNQTGLYSVRIPSPYCVLTDTIRVLFLRCNPFVPNVFTPNGDGKNDFFVIDHDDERRLTWDLEVFNRWGKLVYSANPYGNNWDGGKLPAGAYYYLLTNRQNNRRLKGWVVIHY